MCLARIFHNRDAVFTGDFEDWIYIRALAE